MTAGSASRKRNGPNYNLQGDAEHCLLNTLCEIPAASSTNRGNHTQNHSLQVHVHGCFLIQGNKTAIKFTFFCLLGNLAKSIVCDKRK